MGYYLNVITGPDQGKNLPLEEGEFIAGRSPSAHLNLTDEAISWEHAQFRVENGKLFVRNLSALGTKLRGKKLSADTRLADGDELELSPNCTVGVREDDDSERSGPPAAVLVLAGLLLVLIVGGGTIAYTTLTKGGPRPITPTHWRTAYTRISERMDRWVVERQIPDRALQLLRDGWRLEQAVVYPDALRRWEQLNSLLLTMRAPLITNDELTFTESASPSARVLNIVMGWDQSARNSEFEWNTNEAYADALVWFVRRRAEIVRKIIQDDAKARKEAKKKKK